VSALPKLLALVLQLSCEME